MYVAIHSPIDAPSIFYIVVMADPWHKCSNKFIPGPHVPSASSLHKSILTKIFEFVNASGFEEI